MIDSFSKPLKSKDNLSRPFEKQKIQLTIALHNGILAGGQDADISVNGIMHNKSLVESIC